MGLESGSMLSHYRLAGKIGEGGMGEVYRARDTKLDRDVALKILPEAFANDSERMARFAREAQLLASLNHPHVGGIYGLEDDGGVKALVLELIEGETLGERMARGPVPLQDALPIAAQIAEAMEAAHDQGIIHRDLKPANVKLTPAGKVKVLDFGLAKALADEPGAAPDLTRSPTLTVPATQAGYILGTASYMAPEQARGLPVDRRADIWAFGVVLFEMLTGRRLHAGDTVTDILAAVVRAEPEWGSLPPETPSALRRLLERCLAKDPTRRLRDFGDARLDIREAIESPHAPEAASSAPAPRPAWKRALPWAAMLVIGAVAAVAGFVGGQRSHREPVVHASILPPEDTAFNLEVSGPGAPALSPDGRMMAFSARDAEGAVRLFVRRLDASEAYVLSGTEGAQFPFWSPDSRWIGFFNRGDASLKKIAASGGPPLTLCAADNGKGGAWTRDGRIIFAASHDTGLSVVRDSGGIPQTLTTLDADKGDNSHRLPVLLPDGRHILYLARGRKLETGGQHALLARSIDGESGGEEKFVMQTDAGAQFASGHLLFLRDGVLMAQPFDPGRLEPAGDPFPLAEKVAIVTGASTGVFTASGNGVLAYLQGVTQSSRTLSWRDTEGVPRGTLGDEAVYLDVRLSPDGSHAAVTIFDDGRAKTDLWVYEVERDLRTRFTFSAENESNPAWSPDGKRVYFSGERDGIPQIFVKPIGGTGDEELVYESDIGKYVRDVSPDGRYLTYVERSAETGWDVWALPLDGDGNPFLIAGGNFAQADGVFSPDGRWLAYISTESGRSEVYVTPFPVPGRKWQISTKGGDNPTWGGDGRQLYYQDSSGAVTAVDIEVRDNTLVAGAPRTLFEAPFSAIYYYYAPAPDGQRFLIVDDSKGDKSAQLSLVLNWTEAATP